MHLNCWRLSDAPVEAALSMVDVFSFVRTKGFLKHPDDCHHFHNLNSDF